MKHKLLSLILALIASVGIIFAQSGTCGDNLTWTYSSDSVLTISGTGPMTDFSWSDSVPWNAFSYLGIKSVIIEEGVTSIGSEAFAECCNLTSVTIPNSVTSIGNWAFSLCNCLTALTIPNSVISIGEGAFDLVPNIIYTNGSTDPWGARCVNGYVNGYFVFRDEARTCLAACSGKAAGDIIIPNSVTSIEYNAFYNCGNITSIEIPNSVMSIKGYAFAFCTNLTSVTIPNSVTSIGDYVFYYCIGLTSVTIPSSVTSIGNWAFYYCSGLTSVTIGNSVTSIGSYAFYDCSGLTTVTIPISVTSIGNWAFAYCGGLTSITCTAVTPPTCEGTSVFRSVNKSIPVYVPAESVAAYQAADVWKEFLNILPIEETVDPKDSIYDIIYLDQAGLQIETEPIILHLPVAPVIEGFTFLKWQVVAGDLEQGIYIQAVYTANDPTNAPAVYTNPANKAQKLIRNGQVYILTDDKIYSVTGQKVR